jgi:hypothetical protein
MVTLPTDSSAYGTDISQLDVTCTSYKERTSCFSFRFNEIVRLMFLTESFTWEELPATDPETGSLTMAGWIPRLQAITIRFIYFIPVFHLSYGIARIVLLAKRPLPYNSWYPFDTTISPTYELIFISQVTTYYRTVTFLSHQYTDLVNTKSTSLSVFSHTCN